ncbi:MAG: hypothetical protein KC468_05400, partial [Myxococcales bacterium]|nr:hypothetical protein [Myxococcales bacterium]
LTTRGRGEAARPSRLPPRARERTGDLFEHFGVRPEPRAAATPSAPPRATRATACRGCGWVRALVDTTCPMCGLHEAPE